MKKKIAFFLSVLLCLHVTLVAQVSILSSGFHPMNVTPASMLQVTVMSDQNDVTSVIESEITNSSGQTILKVVSLPVKLKAGVNQLLPDQIKTASITYGTIPQAGFAQTHRTLPSGLFKYCVRITVSGGEYTDEYCDDVQSDFSSYLNLVSPFDKDTIDTKTPLLIWTHSEPFNLLSPGEFFRITVAEIHFNQNPEAALAANQPVFFRNAVMQHEVQYPFDAKQLEEGKTYAWQVQKMAAGGQTIIDKTEAWSFHIPAAQTKPVAYYLLEKKEDGEFISCKGDYLYFRFDEEYTLGNMQYYILNNKGEKLRPRIEKNKSHTTEELSASGINYFQLDVSGYGLKTGNYTLIVLNAKNEKFYLRFHVDK